MKIPAIQRSPRWRCFTRAISIWCIAGFLAATWSVGAEPEDPPLLEIEARFVHATEKQVHKAFGPSSARQTLGSALSSDQAEKALRTLGKMKAEFFSSLRAVTRSGQRAAVETVREMRYPTQFDPSKDEPGKLVPVAFETRNVGVTFEFEAFEKDGQIHLNVVPKIVRFLGFIDYGPHNTALLKNGRHPKLELWQPRLTEGGIWQPVFSTQQINTTFQMKSGDTILVGELPIQPVAREFAPESLRTFVFITARSLPVSNASPESHPPTP